MMLYKNVPVQYAKEDMYEYGKICFAQLSIEQWSKQTQKTDTAKWICI